MPQLFRRRIIIIVIVILFLVIDYQMGPYVAFPILFIIPIVVTTWWHGRLAGIVLATILALARSFCSATWELPIPNLTAYMVINTIIREIAFIFVVLLVDRLAVQQRELERKVNILEGILPICSYCKKIRDEDGDWEQLELYITRRSEAQFSHSICPTCREQYFGGVRRVSS
jgi:K+-sensing histidine kinase KdpD